MLFPRAKLAMLEIEVRRWILLIDDNHNVYRKLCHVSYGISSLGQEFLMLKSSRSS